MFQICGASLGRKQLKVLAAGSNSKISQQSGQPVSDTLTVSNRVSTRSSKHRAASWRFYGN